MVLVGETEVVREEPVTVPLCPPQMSHGLVWDRTRASAVKGKQLIAWAMAVPLNTTINPNYIYIYIYIQFAPRSKHSLTVIKRQAIYVQCNIQARSCNHCCSGKTISITYSKCVFVALGTQCEMYMRHFVICCLSGSPVFSTLSHKRHDFRKKKSFWTQNVCFDFVHKSVWNISHFKKKWARYQKRR